jgi:hypothetical protein
LVLGLMALGRIRRPEGLRQIPPGEFGKVIGLDRVPEVRTSSEKVALMAATGDHGAWNVRQPARPTSVRRRIRIAGLSESP